MARPLSLIAIVGSLRQGSYNRAVFAAAGELVDGDVRLTEAPVTDVPFYNGDTEAAGDPPAVVALKQAVEESDALLIFTPEYNGGVPAVTKNAVDWLSRPPGDSALARATVGVIAATPGRGAAAGAIAHLGDSLARAGRVHDSPLGLASISRAIHDGQLVDPEARDRLQDWLAGFVTFVKEPPAG